MPSHSVARFRVHVTLYAWAMACRSASTTFLVIVFSVPRTMTWTGFLPSSFAEKVNVATDHFEARRLTAVKGRCESLATWSSAKRRSAASRSASFLEAAATLGTSTRSAPVRSAKAFM